MKKFNKKGFSLIELMVTMAIIAIIATIAIPRFMDYLDKMKRQKVFNALIVAKQSMSRYYSNTKDLKDDNGNIIGYKILQGTSTGKDGLLRLSKYGLPIETTDTSTKVKFGDDVIIECLSNKCDNAASFEIKASRTKAPLFECYVSNSQDRPYESISGTTVVLCRP